MDTPAAYAAIPIPEFIIGSRASLMIALCAGCHAKLHRTKVVLTEFPRLLLELWREQHPEGHEQTYIDFSIRKPAAQSVPLNFEDAKEDCSERNDDKGKLLIANGLFVSYCKGAGCAARRR